MLDVVVGDLFPEGATLCEELGAGICYRVIGGALRGVSVPKRSGLVLGHLTT